MSESNTVIGALRFNNGVVIAADSQASDTMAEVRWRLEKLDRIAQYPCVIGFSGNVSRGQEARNRLNTITLYDNQFDKKERIHDAVYKCLKPVYTETKRANKDAHCDHHYTCLWGLMAFWAENSPHIMETGINGDCEFHEGFYVIGSGAKTAFAIYRTLGGNKLSSLPESFAIDVVLRILRTCIDVELMGVSEPIHLWIVSDGQARQLSEHEIQPHLQSVAEWEEEERSNFFEKAIPPDD